MDNKELNFAIERFLNDFKHFKKEKETLINTCKNMINTYQAKIDMYNDEIESKEQYVKSNISALLDANFDEMQETKTQFSYNAPSAKLVIKKSTENLKLNKNYNLDEIPERFIKTEKKVDWGAYKKILKIESGNVVNIQTGEIIESVTIEKKEPSDLKITFKD